VVTSGHFAGTEFGGGTAIGVAVGGTIIVVFAVVTVILCKRVGSLGAVAPVVGKAPHPGGGDRGVDVHHAAAAPHGPDIVHSAGDDSHEPTTTVGSSLMARLQLRVPAPVSTAPPPTATAAVPSASGSASVSAVTVAAASVKELVPTLHEPPSMPGAVPADASIAVPSSRAWTLKPSQMSVSVNVAERTAGGRLALPPVRGPGVMRGDVEAGPSAGVVSMVEAVEPQPPQTRVCDVSAADLPAAAGGGGIVDSDGAETGDAVVSMVEAVEPQPPQTRVCDVSVADLPAAAGSDAVEARDAVATART
jgi:hypothetical protein